MGIYKIEVCKDDQIINSLNQWLQFGGPKKEEHWKDGRSAKELAKYILSGNGYFPKEIEVILQNVGCKNDKVFIGEPEKVTSLVGRGMGRNHDLFFKQDEEIVIGIESKADENLGKMVSEELNYKNISDNKINRINTLYKNIYGCNPGFGGDNSDNSVDIRYQLLTGVSGTLLEAKKLHTPKALFIIVTFKKVGCYNEKKLNSNKNDINAFISSLSANKVGDYYNFNEYPNINLYIEHMEIDVK